MGAVVEVLFRGALIVSVAAFGYAVVDHERTDRNAREWCRGLDGYWVPEARMCVRTFTSIEDCDLFGESL